MDTSTFLNTVQQRLHPEPYSCCLDPKGSPFDLILWRRRARLAHDVLGVIEFRPDSEPRAQIEAARQDVLARFGTACFTHEVVLHVLVHGREPVWRRAMGEMCADRLGFRGVMIQSVHFMDSDTHRVEHSISAWGPVKYALRGHVLVRELESLLRVAAGPATGTTAATMAVESPPPPSLTAD